MPGTAGNPKGTSPSAGPTTRRFGPPPALAAATAAAFPTPSESATPRLPGLLLAFLLAAVCACGGGTPQTDPLTPAPRDPDAADPTPPAPVEAWRRTITDEGAPRIPSTAAAVGTGAVFVAYPGELLALDAASGDRLWSLALPAPLATPPAIAGDSLVVTLDAVEGDTRFPSLWWVSPADGSVRENVPLPRPATALAPFGDDVVVLDRRELRRMGRPAPRTIWSIAAPDVSGLRTAPGSNSVYLSGPGLVDAVDATTGELRWRRDLRRPGDGDGEIRLTRVAVGAERVFVAGTHDRLEALRARDGDSLWRRDLGTDVVAAPVVTADVVWVAPFDAGVQGFDAGNGTLLERESLSARTYVDLTTLGPWAIVGPLYGPWVRIRPPVEEAGEQRAVRDTLAAGSDLRLSPIAGPSGLALIGGDGTVTFLRLPDRTVEGDEAER